MTNVGTQGSGDVEDLEPVLMDGEGSGQSVSRIPGRRDGEGTTYMQEEQTIAVLMGISFGCTAGGTDLGGGGHATSASDPAGRLQEGHGWPAARPLAWRGWWVIWGAGDCGRM